MTPAMMMNDCTPSSSFACGLSPGTSTGSKFYNRHFRPDTGGAFTELGAFGGNRQTIDSDYFFPHLRAGNDISVYHVPATAPETLDSVISITGHTDVDALLTGTGISS